MDLSSVETTLVTWIEQASSLEVEWGKQPMKVHMGPFILAYAGAITKIGHDERIQTYDANTDSTSVRVVGVRRLPLRLSFRSFDQRLGDSARQFAEEFRALAHSDTCLQTLATAEIALVDTGELVESDYEWSGRTVSQVDLTVVLSLRASFSDALHDGSYIKHVNAEQDEYVVDENCDVVVDEDGNPVTSETIRTINITT
jgi:hypothetical protein